MWELIAYSWFPTAGAAFVAMGCSFVLFDRLLRVQYSQHRSEWEEAGCPPGYFWMPRGMKRGGGPHARAELHSQWKAEAPAWASDNPVLERDYRWFRRISWLSTVLMLAFLAQFLFLFLSVLTGGFARQQP